MPRTRYFDLTGQKFGRLTVESRLTSVGDPVVKWKCVCFCGTSTVVATANLRNKSTNSCGCKRKEIASKRFTTHGMTKSSTYRVWSSMRTRCTNPKATNYNVYGGRGIQCCSRWESFELFLEDMGERPPSMTLDRINVNGNYESGNCKWASIKEQAKNKRKTKLINQDSLLAFLKTQSYLSEEQQLLIATNFFTYR